MPVSTLRSALESISNTETDRNAGSKILKSVLINLAETENIILKPINRFGLKKFNKIAQAMFVENDLNNGDFLLHT